MTDLKISGTPLKAKLLKAATAEAATLRRPPCLTLVGIDFGDVRSRINIRIHERCFEDVGIEVRRYFITNHDGAEEELLGLIREANDDDGVDAIMALLPFPPGMDIARVISTIEHSKEVEGLHLQQMMRNHPLAPPSTVPRRPPIVPQATLLLLNELGFMARDAHVVIMNSARMVAENPVSRAITSGGTLGVAEPGTAISVVPHTNPEARTLSRMADLVLVSVDEPDVVDGDWVKPGAVVIDYNAIADTRPGASGVVGGVNTDSVIAAGASVAPIPGGFGPVLLGCVAARIVRMSAERQPAQAR